MKTGRHGKKRQQQSGRAVLVTFYVARPRRKDGGGASAGSSRHVHHHHHHHDVHHHHHHHHLHHGSDEARRRGSENRRSYDRRAELLEYSRQMRASAAAATARPARPEEPLHVEAAGAGGYPVHPPPASDPRFIYIAGLIESLSGGAVRLAGHPPAAAGDDRRLVERRRLERAESQQQVRQRCLGLGGGWSWKRVLRLVLPCQSSTGRPSARSRTRGRDDDGGKEDGKAARGWPAAAQLVSKLKVNRTSRRTGNGSDEGLLKLLFSTFQRQRSRPGRCYWRTFFLVRAVFGDWRTFFLVRAVFGGG